jgi:hypothetical protein
MLVQKRMNVTPTENLVYHARKVRRFGAWDTR